VRRRLRCEDLSVLGDLDDAHERFTECRDAAGRLVAAAYAVQTIASAYANFRGASRWVERLRDAQAALPALSERERLVVLGAIVSATVIVDTTGFDSPEIAAAVEEALQLTARDLGADARDDVVAVARALLEYAEQQGQADTFHRVVRTTAPHIAYPSLGPLIAGRYLIYQARCLFRLGAYDPTKAQDSEALALLDRAESVGACNRMPHLLFDVRYARILLAAIRNDTARLPELVGLLHEVLDYERPNCVALYYQHLARVHLMRDEVAQAFEASQHALRTAELGACVSGERRSYRIMYALALLASGQHDRSIGEIAAMLDDVSGRPRAILECTMRFAEAWRARETASKDYRDCLNRAMRQAEELNWPLFLNSLPRIAARLIADALDFGLDAELACRAIALRALFPPPDAEDRWPWPIRVYTLGRFSIVVDGRAVEFAGKAQRKPLDLLKLIVASRHPVDYGMAIEHLWPDLDGDAGRNAFDLALLRLRKLVGHERAVNIQNGRLVLDRTQVWVDAWSFELACAEVDRLAAEPAYDRARDCDSLAARLLRHYAGEFLAGDETHWALRMRERLRSKLLRAFATLGQFLERESNVDRAILLYRRAIEIDPLAEEFCRRLMLCYRAEGRIAEALDAYRRCRDVISIMLGVAPSASTQAIYQSLKQP
jgi:DNA-binding SARP family transcriptional activator